MAKLKEGDIFTIPIGNNKIIGLIVRMQSNKIPFGFFYKRIYTSEPSIKSLSFDETEIIYKSLFGVQGFRDGKWKVIGSLQSFSRDKWLVPTFYNKSFGIPGELIFFDDNLNEIKRERAPLSEEFYVDYPGIGLGGSGYIKKNWLTCYLFNSDGCSLQLRSYNLRIYNSLSTKHIAHGITQLDKFNFDPTCMSHICRSTTKISDTI